MKLTKLIYAIEYPAEIPVARHCEWQYVKLRGEFLIKLKELLAKHDWKKHPILSFKSSIQDMVIKSILVKKYPEYTNNWRLGHDGQVIHYVTQKQRT